MINQANAMLIQDVAVGCHGGIWRIQGDPPQKGDMEDGVGLAQREPDIKEEARSAHFRNSAKKPGRASQLMVAKTNESRDDLPTSSVRAGVFNMQMRGQRIEDAC